jgi:hypothetical protein
MAYNAVSGTLIAAQNYIPPYGQVVANVVSGNLSTSDGANVINVPRVSNATNNSIITNVGGNANTLTCESNLKFDGNTLNITGDLTASVGLSASFLYGDGRFLTNVSAGGSATGQGPVNSLQFNTGSGGISGSSNLIFSSNVLQVGGGLKLNRRLVTNHVTAAVNDYFIGVDSTGGSFEVRLLPAASLSNGQKLVIKDEGGQAGSNNVTIKPAGSQTIDGQNSIVLESPNASIQLYCDGNSKYFVF